MTTPEWEIAHGDCVALMRTIPDNSIDSVVTDPPYDLTAKKRGGSGPASVNLETPYGRARIGTGNGGGFMGQAWDATGIAFDPATWREALRILKPGGHLVAFGGSRTYHRMACAIEDAGFEVRDSLHWMYGTGFPKSLNLGDGRGTALKPAHEPIVLARKPIVGTVAANLEAHGTGTLNIDGCRVAFASEADEQESKKKNQHGDFGSAPPERIAFGRDDRAPTNYDAAGRWPPNVLLDEEAAAELDTQTGVSKSTKGKPRAAKKPGDGWGMCATGAEYDDAGGASRFFPVFRYEAKPTRAERNIGGADNVHPTVKPIALMRWLVRLVTPPGGIALDPFTGSGTTGIACVLEGFPFIGFEQSAEYVQIARARIAHHEKVRSAA